MNGTGAFANFFTLLSSYLVFQGLVLPGVDKLWAKFKVLIPVVKRVVFLTYLLQARTIFDSVIGIVNEALKGNLEFFLRRMISALTTIQAIYYVWLLTLQRKRILKIVAYLDTVLSLDMGRNNKKRLMEQCRKTVSYIVIAFCVTGVTQTSFFIGRIVYKFHQPPLGIPYRVENKVLLVIIIVMQMLNGVSHYMSISVNAWILLSFSGAMAVEIKVLRERLGQIFSIIHSDPNGNVFIKKTMYSDGVDSEITDDSDNSGVVRYKNVVEAEGNPGYKETQLNYADRMLTEWIKRHSEVMKHADVLSDLFGVSILFSYATAILTTLSVVFTSFSGKFSMSLPIFSLLFLMLLYSLASFGERLKEMGATISYDALGKDFHLYPVKMQRALLLIIRVSQNKDLQICYKGLYPLSRAEFLSVINICYSTITFIAGL